MKQFMAPLQPQLRKKGIEGLVEMIDRPNHRLWTRLLLAIDKRFVGLAQFARDWAGFERQIAYRPVPEVARELYSYLALELHVRKLPTVFSQPGHPAILLGLNHEAVLEPIVLVSLLNRNDIRFIGMKVFRYLGRHIADYILPVLPKKVAIDYRGDEGPSLANRLDPVYQLYSLENRTVAEIRQLNQQAIQQAAEHLYTGGVFIIFPNGGRGIEQPWYSGVGEIVSQLPAEILYSMPIYPIAVTAFSRRMFYQKVHQAVFDRRRPTAMQVNLYDPIYLPSWAAGRMPEEIVGYLKQEAEARRSKEQKGRSPIEPLSVPRASKF